MCGCMNCMGPELYPDHTLRDKRNLLISKEDELLCSQSIHWGLLTKVTLSG